MRFSNLGQTADGTDVDLVVSVAAGSTYTPANYANTKLEGKFAHINLKIDTVTDLTFSFVDTDDNPLTLPAATLTFFDFDEGFSGGQDVVESICVASSDLESHQAGADVLETSQSTLCDGVTAGSSIHFESTAKGYGCDNPTDPLVLPILTCEECQNCVSNPGLSGNFPIDTSARVVELVLTSVSSVTLRASISGAQGLSGGRSFLFAGKSAIANPCTAQPTPMSPAPSLSVQPSLVPTVSPSEPSGIPSPFPSVQPTAAPSNLPSSKLL